MPYALQNPLSVYLLGTWQWAAVSTCLAVMREPPQECFHSPVRGSNLPVEQNSNSNCICAYNNNNSNSNSNCGDRALPGFQSHLPSDASHGHDPMPATCTDNGIVNSNNSNSSSRSNCSDRAQQLQQQLPTLTPSERRQPWPRSPARHDLAPLLGGVDPVEAANGRGRAAVRHRVATASWNVAKTRKSMV